MPSRIKDRRVILPILLSAVLAAAIVSAALASGVGKDQLELPTGCVKPSGGFLVIASNLGWNDSETHGAPAKPWPIINVRLGETVNITVCSISNYPHSFEITPHYFPDPLANTLVDGQVLRLSFVADRAGTFLLQCGLPCPIHVYMENGEFIVSA